MRSLIKEFYATLHPQISKKQPNKTYKLNPSSLGTKCLRKLYYGAFKVPQDFDVPPNVKKMGAMGDGISHILSNKFRERGILIDYKEPDGSFQDGFNGEPNLEFPVRSKELKLKKGYIDAVLVLDGKLWLGEYKSATQGSFSKLKAPKPDHMVQGVEYLFVFNKQLQDGAYKHIKELDKFERAEGIIFLYVDRDNAVDFNMKEYPIDLKMAEPTFIQIVQKVAEFSQYADKKELPPKTPEWCNSCPWRAKCKKNFNIP